MKEKREKLRDNKLKGHLIRTRLQHIEDGEKPSKYLCYLEKSNYISKTITHIKKKMEPLFLIKWKS